MHIYCTETTFMHMDGEVNIHRYQLKLPTAKYSFFTKAKNISREVPLNFETEKPLTLRDIYH